MSKVKAVAPEKEPLPIKTAAPKKGGSKLGNIIRAARKIASDVIDFKEMVEINCGHIRRIKFDDSVSNEKYVDALILEVMKYHKSKTTDSDMTEAEALDYIKTRFNKILSE